MATSNATITKTWTKVADDTDDPVLVTSRSAATIEFALTATDAAPDLQRGHLLMPDEAITRIVAGDGFLWMRVEPGSAYASAKIEATK
jgi:hypothetical protein